MRTDEEHGKASILMPRTAIIACSPVLAAMFNHDTEEARSQKIVFKGFSAKVTRTYKRNLRTTNPPQTLSAFKSKVLFDEWFDDSGLKKDDEAAAYLELFKFLDMYDVQVEGYDNNYKLETKLKQVSFRMEDSFQLLVYFDKFKLYDSFRWKAAIVRSDSSYWDDGLSRRLSNWGMKTLLYA